MCLRRIAGRILGETHLASDRSTEPEPLPSIVPQITGQAWVTQYAKVGVYACVFAVGGGGGGVGVRCWQAVPMPLFVRVCSISDRQRGLAAMAYFYFFGLTSDACLITDCSRFF